MTPRPPVVALLVASAAGCVLQTPDEQLAPRGEVRSVVIVAPPSALLERAAIQLQAVVTGTGPVPQQVSWSLPGGEGWARLSQDGQLRVDVPLSDPVLLTVRATSVVDSAVFSEALLRIPAASIQVEPASQEVVVGESVRFTALVVGVADSSVTWWASTGTIDASGLFTAPAGDWYGPSPPMVQVQATSAALRRTAIAWAVLRPRTVTLTGTAGPARPGDVIQLRGTSLDALSGWSPRQAAFEGSLGGSPVLADAFLQGPAGAQNLQVTVPSGVSSGTVRLRGAWSGLPVETNAIPFERVAALRLHPDRYEVAAGEATAIRAAVLGGPASAPVDWRADVGTVVNGVYTAPTGMPLPAYANVKACLAGSTACAGTTLALRAFRVEPQPAIVAAGGTLALRAVGAAGTLPATFLLASGHGAVTADGRFTASAAPTDGGSTWLLATVDGVALPVQLAVTGGAPGRVASLAEPIDPAAVTITAGVDWGSSAGALAADATRLYAAGSSRVSGAGTSWIDVYVAADPMRPAWLGSVEARTSPTTLALAHGWLLAGEGEGVELFDLSGPLPVSVLRIDPPARISTNDLTGVRADAEEVVVFGNLERVSGAWPITIYRLADRPLQGLETVLQLPPDFAPQSSILGSQVAAGPGRAYVRYGLAQGGQAVAAYDLTAAPPVLLWTLASQAGFLMPLQLHGHLLQDGWAWADQCADVRLPAPAWAPCPVFPSASQGSRGVRPGSTGWMELMELTDPAAPAAAGLIHGARASGAFVNGAYLEGQGVDGLAAYDLGPAGGLGLGAGRQLPAGSVSTSVEALQRGSALYLGGSLGNVALLQALDLASAEPLLTWSIATAAPVQALVAAGGLLLAGGADGLRVLDLADPLLPASLTTVPLDVGALALAGSVAFVGTRAGEVVALDLAVPSAPLELGRLTLGTAVRALALMAPGQLVAGLGAASGTAGGLAVVDVTVPAAPLLTGSVALGAPACGIALTGAVAAVKTTAGLATVNLQDPASPLPLAEVPLPDYGGTGADGACPGRGVLLAGGLAWTWWSPPSSGPGSMASGLHAYDLASPAWPRLIAEWPKVERLLDEGGTTWSLARSAYGSDLLLAPVDLSRPGNVILAPAPAPWPIPGVTP